MQNRPRTTTPLALTTLLCALLGAVSATGPDAALALISFLLVAVPAIEAHARSARCAAVRVPSGAPRLRALARCRLYRPSLRRMARVAVIAHRRGCMDAVATPLIA